MVSESSSLRSERKILTFTLDDQVFGIDTDALIEVREWTTPTALPKMHEYMCGVINLRGTPIPIIDLSERLDRPATGLHAQSCVIVVRVSDQSAGFLVNRIIDITAIRTEDVQAAPELEQEFGTQGAITGVVDPAALGQSVHRAAGSSMVTLLDLAALNVIIAPELRRA